MRHALPRALAAALFALAASTSQAQFSNFYSFGDSLSDVGSFKPLGIFPPDGGVATTNPGPIWNQVLATRYGLSQSPANQGGNAYGQLGARVSQNPGVPDNFPPTAGATPIVTQINQYLAQVPVDRSALYSVWGGANDIFTQLGLLQAGQITQAQLQANVGLAATQLVGGVGQLTTAGVQNLLVFNLPDIGRTPFGQGSGQAASISAITNLYNTTLNSGLNTLGGNVIRVNVNALFNEVLSDPQRYGFLNTTGFACTSFVDGRPYAPFCDRSTLVSPESPQTYVFADLVHPTEAAHAVVAQLAASMIEGPQKMATLAEAPLAVEAANFRAVDGRMQSSLGTPRSTARFQPWVAYDYANPDLEGSFTNGDADLNTIAVGGDTLIFDGILIGGAFGYTENKADFGNGGFKLKETTGTFYAGTGRGPWYVGTRMGAGDLEYDDIHRDIQLGSTVRTESGATSGWHYFISALGGYWFQHQSLLHGPWGKVTWQDLRVRGFSENGAQSTTLSYGEQEREALQFSLGWQVAGQVGAIRPFGRVTWEYDAKADDRSVTATPLLTGGTYTVGTYSPDSNYVLFNFGASTDFGRVTAYLTGSATASKSDGDYYAVTVGVRIPLQ